MTGNKEYTTAEICRLTGKDSQVVCRWARNNDVKYTGTKSGKRYTWSQEKFDQYLEYVRTTKVGRKASQRLAETTNLDTLYHRLIRSRKNGNKELYNQTRKILDDLKKKNKDN